MQINNQAISASAGTGKTYTLATRYIRLLAAGAEPESIVAMTFTRKAAGEILDRIISLMCEWIENPVEFEKIKKANKYSELQHEKLAPLLSSVLMKIHKLQISTLDSFYTNIIKTFPFEFGLNGDFQILDGAAEENAKIAVLKDILWNNTDIKEKKNFLTAFRLATYGHEEKSILTKMKDFVNTNHKAFMENQREERWGDLNIILDGNLEIMGTKIDLQAECRKFRDLIPNIAFTHKKQEQFLEKFIDELDSFDPVKPPSSPLFQKLLPVIDDLRAGNTVILKHHKEFELEGEECEVLYKITSYIIREILKYNKERTRGMYQVMKRYEKSYDNLNRRNGLFTFKDILHQLSLSIFDDTYPTLSGKKTADKMYIDYRLDTRFDHWLLDEFQDTSYTQWKVIENLVDEVMQDQTGTRSFFYVGDIKQSIYQWRSGDPKLFNAILERYKNYNIERTPLTKSYRSYKEITDTVNMVFFNLCESPLLQTHISKNVADRMEWKTHESNYGAGGFSALIGMKFENKENNDEKAEKKAKIIAERIKEIAPLKKGWTSTILLRTHKYSAIYERVLLENDIPVSRNSDIAIAEAPLTAAFLSLIKLADHPQDAFAKQHLAMTPFANIIKDYSTISINLLNDIYNKGYKYLIEKWLKSLTLSENNNRNYADLENARNLLDAAEQFDTSTLSAPADFIEFISAYTIKPPVNAGTVQIMTIHASKGLGFDIVFMPEFDGTNSIDTAKTDGLQTKKNAKLEPEWAFMMPSKDIAKALPGLSSYVKEKAEDQTYENLCVLYVAMTRAAKALYIITDKCESGKTTSVRESDILLETLHNPETNKGSLPSLTDAEWLYSTGNPNWAAKLAEKENKPATGYPEPESTGSTAFTINFPNALERATPSGNEPYITYGENLFSGASSNAMELGSAVHELFEELTWSDKDTPETVITKWQSRTSFNTDIQNSAIQLFTKALEFPEFYDALKQPENEAILWREKDFSVIINNQWINGSFDRVVIQKDISGNIIQATIMDYKTDRAENETELKQKAQIYSHQLETYSQVLQSILKIDQSKIKSLLLFVRAGKIVVNG
jgi:ATP-dependent helicase/nuclease subunit A